MKARKGKEPQPASKQPPPDFKTMKRMREAYGRDKLYMFLWVAIEKKRYRLLFRSIRKVRLAFKILLGAVAITLFTLPGLYAGIGQDLAVKFFLISLTVFLIATLYAGVLRGMVFGMVVGYVAGFIFKYIPGSIHSRSIILVEIKVMVVTILAFASLTLGLGLITDRRSWAFLKNDDETYHYKTAFRARHIIKRYITWSVCCSMVTSFIGVVGWGLSARVVLISIYIGTAITSFYLSISIGLVSGAYAGLLIRERLNPTVLVANNVIPYLKEMVVPTIGFTLGYLFIIFLFANFYWAIWHFDPLNSFNNVPPSASLGAFMYFSLITIATVGYGDITPASSLARTLVSVEIIVGLGWVTVVFAALIAYLQPRFNAISERQQRRGQIKKTAK